MLQFVLIASEQEFFAVPNLNPRNERLLSAFLYLAYFGASATYDEGM